MYYELAASQAVQHFVDTAAEAPNVKQRLSDEIIDKLGSGGDPSMDVRRREMGALPVCLSLSPDETHTLTRLACDNRCCNTTWTLPTLATSQLR